MSAIWGAIDFSGRDIPEEHKQIFRDAFSKCVIDRTEEISDKGVYMGCGIRYINAEAKNEKLPCRNGGVFFTGDIILDNRDEVFAALGMQADAAMPDGELVRLCFEKKGKESLNLLLGAYAFAVYDRDNKKLELVSDAVGNRYVSYYQQGEVLYFSSLIEPLTKIIGKPKISEAWFAAYLGLYGLDMYADCESEPIEGVFRTEPASYYEMTADLRLQKTIYWDPKNPVKRRHDKDDEGYKEEFLSLYRRCVRDAIRTDGECAIFLSGGYDSTSVACMAAPILKERGKKLYSFTSVPLKEYKSDLGGEYLTDESGVVLKTAEYLGNLEPEFIDLQDVNLWDEHLNYSRIIETPYKSISNMMWLYEGIKKSAAKGAKVILEGAFGNGTVSYNNYNTYMLYLVRSLKLKKYWRELNALHRKHKQSRKWLILHTFSCLLGRNVKGRTHTAANETFARPEFLKKYGIDEYCIRYDEGLKKSYNYHDAYHREFLNRLNMRHYGEFDLKNSLYTGVIMRDPTRDRRMVDFVLSLPPECFSKETEIRRLVSSYMRDIMPPGFFDKVYQGRQSADLKFRLLKEENYIRDYIIRVAEAHKDSPMVDTEKLLDYVRNTKMEDMTGGDIFMCFYTVFALEYADMVSEGL